MIRPAAMDETLLRRAGTAVVALGVGVGVLSAGLGVSLLIERGAVSRAERDRMAAVGRESEASALVHRARTIPARNVPARPDQQLEAFASLLARTCRAANVAVTTFDSSGEMAEYATRYTGATEGKTWKAAEARVSIDGRLADIYTVLAKLRGRSIPFEVASGSIDRGSEGGAVRASMTIVVVVREESGAGRG